MPLPAPSPDEDGGREDLEAPPPGPDRPLRHERCVCGDWISADDSIPELILQAVTAHNDSLPHRVWSARREEMERRMAGKPRRRLSD